jgi:hypothetical protein
MNNRYIIKLATTTALYNQFTEQPSVEQYLDALANKDEYNTLMNTIRAYYHGTQMTPKLTHGSLNNLPEEYSIVDIIQSQLPNTPDILEQVVAYLSDLDDQLYALELAITWKLPTQIIKRVASN